MDVVRVLLLQEAAVVAVVASLVATAVQACAMNSKLLQRVYKQIDVADVQAVVEKRRISYSASSNVTTMHVETRVGQT